MITLLGDECSPVPVTVLGGGLPGPQGPQGEDGSNVIISTSVPVAGKDGDLWWNPDDGALYIWYPESGWTLVFPEGPDAVPMCHVGDIPPTLAQQGDLWWRSNKGELYVYFIDADSAQWVPASAPGAVTELRVDMGRLLSKSGGVMQGQITLMNGSGLKWPNGMILQNTSNTLSIVKGGKTLLTITEDGINDYEQRIAALEQQIQTLLRKAPC